VVNRDVKSYRNRIKPLTWLASLSKDDFAPLVALLAHCGLTTGREVPLGSTCTAIGSLAGKVRRSASSSSSSSSFDSDIRIGSFGRANLDSSPYDNHKLRLAALNTESKHASRVARQFVELGV